MNIRLITLLTALSFSAGVCLAGKAAELKPTLAKPGKVLAEDNFNSDTLGKMWTAAKGDWQIRDGALIGKEKTEDKHAGVCMLALPIHDAIIRFSFKLDGATSFSLSYNHAKGHLFRVNVDAGGVALDKDKDKHDANSKGLVLGKSDVKCEPGQWHTMLVEVKGGKVALQIDNGVKLEANNSELDVDKTGYRFVVHGASIALDDVKAWDLAP